MRVRIFRNTTAHKAKKATLPGPGSKTQRLYWLGPVFVLVVR